MSEAKVVEENERYNDEIGLLDGLYEFHPEYFNQLAPGELEILRTYYLLGQEVPENVFEYRKELMERQLGIETEVQAVLAKLLEIANIKKPD